MKCFCGREFTDRRHFAMHLSRIHETHFESGVAKERYLCDVLFGADVVDATLRKYLNEEISASELSTTTNIVKLIELMGIKRSHSEEKRTARYKRKYENTMKCKYGDNIINPSQLKEVQEKKKQTAIKNYGSYENYLDKQRLHMKDGFDLYKKDPERILKTTEKVKKTCCEKYGHPNFGAGVEAKAKRMATMKEIIETWEYEERLARTSKARESVNHRGGFSSKPEKRIRFCLSDLDIDFRQNVHLWHYNYDILFENFIIEVHGDMWHANPSKYKATDLIMGKILASDLWKKDAIKKRIAEKNGFKLIEIWECDIIKKTDEELIMFVKKKLEESGYVFK